MVGCCQAWALSDNILFIMLKISLVLLLLFPTLIIAGESWRISALEWAQPRHGEWLVRHPVLAEAVDELQQQPQSQLQIRYPGGDEGVLWAEELQAWLVALGVPSSRIERVPGSSIAGMIQLDIVK